MYYNNGSVVNVPSGTFGSRVAWGSVGIFLFTSIRFFSFRNLISFYKAVLSLRFYLKTYLLLISKLFVMTYFNF